MARIIKFTMCLLFLLIGIAGNAANPADGDKLYVFTKGATRAIVYSLDGLDKITFDSNSMNIWMNNGQQKIAYEFDNIALLTFREGLKPVSVNLLTTIEEKVQISYNREDYLVSIQSVNPLLNVLICDLQGRMVYDKRSATNHLQLSLSNFPQGVYIVKVQGNGISKSIKIIK